MQIKACQFRLYCQDIINSFTSCVYFCTYGSLEMVCGDTTRPRTFEYKLETAATSNTTQQHLSYISHPACTGAVCVYRKQIQ